MAPHNRQGEARRSTPKRRTEPGKRATIFVPDALLKRVRVRCIAEECSLSFAVTEALKTWVDKAT